MELDEASNGLLAVQNKVNKLIVGLKEEDQAEEDFKLYSEHKDNMMEIIDLTMFKLLIQEEYSDEEKEILFENLRGFLEELKDQNILKDENILELLDEEILESIDYIDKSVYTKKKIRLTTKHFYEQNKYNLLQENSEGFAVLLTELFTSTDSSNFVEKIINIIGYYDLDPNRVCDLMIDVMGCKKSNQELFIGFMKQLNPESVEKIIIRKLGNLLEKDKGKMLIYSAALLVREKLVNSHAIWNALKPTTLDLHKEFDDKYDAIFQLFKRNFVLSFLTTDEDFKKDEEEEKKFRVKAETKIFKNQKFYFLESLLEAGCYDEFIVFYRLVEPSFYFPNRDYIIGTVFDYFKSLVNEIANLLTISSEKVIPESLLNKFWTFLDILKSNIALHTTLFEQVMTILIKLKAVKPSAKTEEYLCKYLIPSLFNSSISDEHLSILYESLGRLLFTYSFRDRYRMYEIILSEYLYQNPYMLNTNLIVRVKKFLKTVCEGKDLEKTNSQIFSKSLKSHPFFVFALTLNNVKMFDNLIGTIITSCEGLPDVVVDICNFLLIRDISGYDKIEISRDNIDPQFVNVCRFISSFAKKHYQSDLDSLVLLIANKMASEEPNDLYFVYLLKYLVSTFLGYDVIHDLNENQAFGMAAGPELRTALLFLDESFEQSKLAAKVFFDCLMNSQYQINGCQSFEMFFILFFQLCKKMTSLVFSSRNKSLKFANQLIDLCQDSKDLMAQFYHMHASQVIIQQKDERFMYILQNEMNLSTYDVFTTVKMLYTENERIEKFDQICQSVKECEKSIMGRNSGYLEQYFEVQNDKSDNEHDIKWLCAFWLFNNKHLTDLSFKYDSYIQKLERIIQSSSDSRKAEEKDTEFMKNKIKNLSSEKIAYANSHKNFLNFYIAKLAHSEFRLTNFMKQACIMQRFVTVQDSLYTANWLKIALINQNTDLCTFYGTVFDIMREVFPLLNGTTDTESANIALFVWCLLKQLQNFYDENEGFEKEIDRIFVKFTKAYENAELQEDKDESVNSEANIEQIKDVIIKELNNFVEDIRVFFKVNQINMCKNAITFMVKLMNVMPLNYKQCVDIVEMLDENKNFIDKFGDLKLRCNAYKQMVKKKMDFYKSLGQEKVFLAVKKAEEEEKQRIEDEIKAKELREKQLLESEMTKKNDEMSEEEVENENGDYNESVDRKSENGANVENDDEEEGDGDYKSESESLDEELKALKNEFGNEIKETKSIDEDDAEEEAIPLADIDVELSESLDELKDEENIPQMYVNEKNEKMKIETNNEAGEDGSDDHSIYTIEEGKKQAQKVSATKDELKLEEKKVRNSKDDNKAQNSDGKNSVEKKQEKSEKREKSREKSSLKKSKDMGKSSKNDKDREDKPSKEEKDRSDKPTKYNRDTRNDKNYNKDRYPKDNRDSRDARDNREDRTRQDNRDYRKDRDNKYYDNKKDNNERSRDSKHYSDDRRRDREDREDNDRRRENNSTLRKRDDYADEDEKTENKAKRFKDDRNKRTYENEQKR